LPRLPQIVIALALAWSCVFLPLVWANQSFGADKDPTGSAIIGMGIGLALVWVVLGGGVQLLLRRKLLRATAPAGDSDPAAAKTWIATRFALSATAMVLVEEAIATTMTNLAEPVWGVSPKKAFITASTNYLEVVLLHSVVVFVPMFFAYIRIPAVDPLSNSLLLIDP